MAPLADMEVGLVKWHPEIVPPTVVFVEGRRM
jgi:hypothetical protein